MKQQRVSNKDYYTSMLLALVSALFLALTGAFGKQLTLMDNLPLVLFLRFFTPFILLAILYFLFSRKNITKNELVPSLLRAIFIVISQYCLFFLLSRGSVLLAILLYSTNSIFSPFLARIIFGAEIKVKTLIAILIGFIGVIITLGTNNSLLSIGTMIGLLSGFFGSCSQLTLHYASKRQDPITNNFITYTISSLLSLAILLIITHTINPSNLNFLLSWKTTGILILFSLFSITNQVSRSLAYKRINKAASLSPFIYTSLIFSAIIDHIWLGIVPTWHVYCGIAIILSASILMAIRTPNLTGP